MQFYEKTIDSNTVYEGSVIKVRVDTVEVSDGKLASRDIVEHPGGVGIIAVSAKGNLILVKQFRKPLDNLLLEIPAGKLNYNEDHYSCGVRELEEETGYSAGSFTYLGYFHPTPGFCDEKLHLYYATDLKEGKANPDEDEFLTVEEIPFEIAVKMVLSGEIKDAKTLIGILLVKEKLAMGIIKQM